MVTMGLLTLLLFPAPVGTISTAACNCKHPVTNAVNALEGQHSFVHKVMDTIKYGYYQPIYDELLDST